MEVEKRDGVEIASSSRVVSPPKRGVIFEGPDDTKKMGWSQTAEGKQAEVVPVSGGVGVGRWAAPYKKLMFRDSGQKQAGQRDSCAFHRDLKQSAHKRMRHLSGCNPDQ